MEFSLPKFPDIKVREFKDGAKFFDVSRKEFICVQHHSWSQIKAVLQENSKDASFNCPECMTIGLKVPKSDSRLKKDLLDCLDMITINLLSFYMILLGLPIWFNYEEKYNYLFREQLWEIIARLETTVGRLTVNRRTLLWGDILKQEFKSLAEFVLPRFFFGTMDVVGQTFEGAYGAYFSKKLREPGSIAENPSGAVYADWIFPPDQSIESQGLFGVEYRKEKGALSIESEMLRLGQREYFEYVRSIHVLLYALGWSVMTKTKADPTWKLNRDEVDYSNMKVFVRNDQERKSFIAQWKQIPYFISTHKLFSELWKVLIDALFI